MTKSSSIKILSGLASVIAIAGLSLVSVKAQDTTVTTLDITPGALTMYAGDATDNNDLCATGDIATYNFMQDGGTTSSVTCSASERRISLTGISVRSTRQNTTPATINDILCEDLTGSENNTYSVSAQIGNLVNQGSGSNVTLGSNPDGITTEADTDKPSALLTPSFATGDDLKIFATIDPFSGVVASIAPEVTRNAVSPDFTSGAKQSVIATATSVGVYSSGADTASRRFDQDGATIKYRIPAFVDAATYNGSIVFTCSAV